MVCGLVASLPTMKLDSVVVETTFEDMTNSTVALEELTQNLLNKTRLEELQLPQELFNETTSVLNDENAELRLSENSTFLLKEALLVPLFDMLTNSSIVSEEMPLVDDLMNELEMNDTGLVNMTLLDSEKKELKFLTNETFVLKNKLDVLQRGLTSDMMVLEKNESNIIDTVLLADKLETLELTAETKGNEILDKLELQLNGTFSELFTNETSNSTFLKSVFNETLSDEERVELLVTKMLNETVREKVMSELDELIEINTELVEVRENATELESLIQNKVNGTMNLIKEIKENESKFQNMFFKLSTDLDKIENVELKINETETQMIDETEKMEVSTLFSNENSEEHDYESDEEYDLNDEDEEDELVVLNAIQVRGISEKLVDYFEKKQREEDSAMLEFITNIYCKLTQKYQYYKSHPTDVTKYVECDPFGKGTIKSCPEGRLWDNFHEICTIKSVIKEGEKMTEMFLELEQIESNFTGINCNSTLFDLCRNGGKCINGFKCECADGFMGEFCTEKVIPNSIYSKIMQNKFDLSEFRKELRMEKNLGAKITGKEMKSIKSFFKDSTHEEIMEYLDLFAKDEIRYDIIINELIDELLEDIYPEAYYISLFNASSGSRLIDVVRLIPSLIQYTRFSENRYADVFLKYQQVLLRFVENMNGTWENVGEQAAMYVKITGHVLNETGVMDQLIGQMSRTSEKEVLETLETESNKTRAENIEFYMQLESLRIRLIDFMRREPECIDKELINIKGSDEVLSLIRIFENLRMKNIEIINSLLSYGFWFVTDAFAGKF